MARQLPDEHQEIINVGVINASTVLRLEEKQKEVENTVKALQMQVNNHFTPVWGRKAHVELVCNRNIDKKQCPDLRPYENWWWLVLLDTTDMAGQLGYRDLTKDGRPLAKVFAKTDKEYGREWTVTASHELLEMLVDPGMSLSAFKEIGQGKGQLYAYDICDPCQAEGYSIDIGGGNNVPVSNFVYPTWFEFFHYTNKNTQVATKFDYNGAIREPFQLLPNGYINVFDIPFGAGWYQIFEKPPSPKDKDNDQQAYIYSMQPPFGSRRERRRRRMSGEEWPWSPPVPEVPFVSG